MRYTGTRTSPRSKPSDIIPTLNPKIRNIPHTPRPLSPLTNQSRSLIIRRRITNLNRLIDMTHIRQNHKSLTHNSHSPINRFSSKSNGIQHHIPHLIRLRHIIIMRHHHTILHPIPQHQLLPMFTILDIHATPHMRTIKSGNPRITHVRAHNDASFPFPHTSRQ